MHILAVNSVATLLNYLTEHLKRTPSTEEIEGWRKKLLEAPAAADGEKGKADDKDKKTGAAAANKPVQPVKPGDAKPGEKVLNIFIPYLG